MVVTHRDPPMTEKKPYRMRVDIPLVPPSPGSAVRLPQGIVRPQDPTDELCSNTGYTPTPSPTPPPTPAGCETCSGRAEIYTLEGDSGAQAELICDHPECDYRAPGVHNDLPKPIISVGVFIGGSDADCAKGLVTPTVTPLPTASLTPSTTPSSLPSATATVSPPPSDTPTLTPTPSTPLPPSITPTITSTPGPRLTATPSLTPSPVIPTPTAIGWPTEDPNPPTPEYRQLIAVRESVRLHVEDPTPVPTAEWCPNPIESGYEYHVSAGAAIFTEIFEAASGEVMAERRWRNFYYGEGPELHVARTVGTQDESVYRWLEESSIRTTKVMYHVRVSSLLDNVLACGRVFGNLGTCFEWSNFDPNTEWDGEDAMIYLPRESELICGRKQKAYAGVWTWNQTGSAAAKGSVYDPEYLSSICPCEFYCPPGVPPIILPPWMPIAEIAGCTLYSALCQAAEEVFDFHGHDFSSVGYDISDLFVMNDRGNQRYDFCGPVNVIDCDPWP